MFQIALQHTERLSTQHWLKSPFLSKYNNIQSPLIISKNHNGYQREGQNKSCSTRIIQKKTCETKKTRCYTVLCRLGRHMCCTCSHRTIECDVKDTEIELKKKRGDRIMCCAWFVTADSPERVDCGILITSLFGISELHTTTIYFSFLFLKTVQKIKKRGYILHR